MLSLFATLALLVLSIWPSELGPVRNLVHLCRGLTMVRAVLPVGMRLEWSSSRGGVSIFTVYGFIWIYMDIYGFIWIYMDLYGFIWIYMDIYIYIYIWIYINMCKYG